MPNSLSMSHFPINRLLRSIVVVFVRFPIEWITGSEDADNDGIPDFLSNFHKPTLK